MLENIAREGVQTIDGSEKGQARARAPPGRIEVPRILYHGTCVPYLYEQMNIHGNYQHVFNRKPICLTEDVLEAICYAMKRGKFYDQEPVVLIAITNRQPRHQPILSDGCGRWTTAFLAKDSFFEYSVGVQPNGKIKDDEPGKIIEFARYVLANKISIEYR